MKRNYVKPRMVIVSLAHNACIMQATSGYVREIDSNNVLDGYGGAGTGPARTKEQSVWDEEW